MARLSEYLLPTQREAPADAEALSHKLMVRAGLIRQLGAGLWTYLPAGWRVQRKVEAIIREEMDAIGAQEVLMPVLQPIENWRKTGRDQITEMFKLHDRREAEMVLAMTHEENVTFHVSQLVSSYRDLPLSLYQIQTKMRDEPRPRAGLLRTREFTMKDSYSFGTTPEQMNDSYELHSTAYERIFNRCGIEWYRVQSDVGMMGGTEAHEYMAPCAAGEDHVALAPGYAANLEIASAQPQPVAGLELDSDAASEVIDTPNLTTVAQLTEELAVEAGTLLKAFPVVAQERGLLLVLVRGDHQVNEVKLRNLLGEPFRQASSEEIENSIGPVGYIGPVGSELPIILDQAVDTRGAYVTGANQAGKHLKGVRPGRDFQFETADIRTVVAGDLVDGNPIRIETAIEIGNIFKLGTRYSEPLGASYLDENGKEKPIWMASYGIGPARVAAAAVEQGADESGISWPKALAPFDIHLVQIGKDQPSIDAANAIYEELKTQYTVLFDDRTKASTGEKFKDAELLGCPLRITVSSRAIENGEYEVQVREGMKKLGVPVDASLLAEISKLWAEIN